MDAKGKQILTTLFFLFLITDAPPKSMAIQLKQDFQSIKVP